MKQKSLEVRTCDLTLALNYFHGGTIVITP